MDDSIPIKGKNRKTKRILLFIIIAALIIALIYFILSFVYPVLLLAGFFDNPPSKGQITNIVNNNIDTFEDAIEYINTLDSEVFGIDYENGFLHLNDSSFLNPQISNATIEEIFNFGVESIYINNKNAEFFCGGAGREYYTGIIYSDSGNPISSELDNTINGEHINFTQTGEGWEWKEEGGDNYYYCENITGNWYYYEMRW